MMVRVLLKRRISGCCLMSRMSNRTPDGSESEIAVVLSITGVKQKFE